MQTNTPICAKCHGRMYLTHDRWNAACTEIAGWQLTCIDCGRVVHVILRGGAFVPAPIAEHRPDGVRGPIPAHHRKSYPRPWERAS